MSTSGPHVSIEAPDAEALAQRLQRFAASVSDARPAFEAMLPYLNRGEEQAWSTSGAALGTHWPPAADPERKVDPRMLVATGALRASLAGQTGESERVATSTELRFGTRVPYARFHEDGTSRMPARPFLGVPDSMSRELVAIMDRYTVGQAGP
jgi:phage gpG-like protein